MTSNMYRIGGKSQFHHSDIYNLFALLDCYTHDCNGCSKIDSIENDTLIYGKLLVWFAECVRNMCNVNHFFSSFFSLLFAVLYHFFGCVVYLLSVRECEFTMNHNLIIKNAQCTHSNQQTGHSDL